MKNQTTTNVEDVQLIDSIKSGNKEDFTILFNKYKNDVKWFLIQKLRYNKELSDDMLMEVFEKVYEKIHLFEYNFKFKTWLYTIANNHIIDFFRKNKKDNQLVSIDEQLPHRESDSADSYQIELPSYITLPDEQIVNKETKTILLDVLGKLPNNIKTVMFMRFFEEKSYEEISDELQIPVGTVKGNVNRGRKKLVEMLKKTELNTFYKQRNKGDFVKKKNKF